MNGKVLDGDFLGVRLVVFGCWIYEFGVVGFGLEKVISITVSMPM